MMLTSPFNVHIAARMQQLGIPRLSLFADHAGINRSTLYSLLWGRTCLAPGVETLTRLAAALQVPLPVLLDELAPPSDKAQPGLRP